MEKRDFPFDISHIGKKQDTRRLESCSFPHETERRKDKVLGKSCRSRKHLEKTFFVLSEIKVGQPDKFR